MPSGDPVFCSSFFTRKSEAMKARTRWRELGGKALSIRGKRGQWRLRGLMNVDDFACFCGEEAVAAIRKEARNQ